MKRLLLLVVLVVAACWPFPPARVRETRTTGITIGPNGLIPFSVPLRAQEIVSLTTPETKPSNAQYTIERITETFDDATTLADEGLIYIQLKGANGEAVSCAYTATTAPTATFLSTGQNKANFSTAYAGNATTGSRRQRIFHRLVVLGESTAVCGKTLTGTVAGVVP